MVKYFALNSYSNLPIKIQIPYLGQQALLNLAYVQYFIFLFTSHTDLWFIECPKPFPFQGLCT